MPSTVQHWLASNWIGFVPMQHVNTNHNSSSSAYSDTRLPQLVMVPRKQKSSCPGLFLVQLAPMQATAISHPDFFSRYTHVDIYHALLIN